MNAVLGEMVQSPLFHALRRYSEQGFSDGFDTRIGDLLDGYYQGDPLVVPQLLEQLVSEEGICWARDADRKLFLVNFLNMLREDTPFNVDFERHFFTIHPATNFQGWLEPIFFAGNEPPYIIVDSGSSTSDDEMPPLEGDSDSFTSDDEMPPLVDSSYSMWAD
jgi:hypothetical protein